MRSVVHTPQVTGKEGAELEQKNYEWFVKNEQQQEQMLKPLDEKSAELPTLNRN